MKQNKIILITVAAIIGLIVLIDSAFILKETQQVVITQFGKPIGVAKTSPGLKFKAPFIQKANYFEKRYLEWDGEPNQVPTKEKKFIFIDTYARWQITDPLQFYKRLTNERGAQSRLDDILDGETRDKVAGNSLKELVRNTNRQAEQTGKISQLINDSLASIQVGREQIQNKIRIAANKQAEDLGIEILDFRFKRINYVEDVRKDVYERMRTERFRIADKFRSEGQGEASEINGKKERELNQIRSEAFKKAEKIKGEADAKAAAIYASAYNRNNTSKKLYEFMKTMETYQTILDTSTTVFLSTDSELFKYLQDIR
ncbi:MAG: protease modulator HflC [Bacteroidales bacterium]|nr:protease modulator HflC [Bacteroidales bacterium]